MYAIKSLKELEKLMQVCRKNGVRNMKIEGFEFTLENDIPQKATGKRNSSHIMEPTTTSAGIITEADQIQTPDVPTLDQLIDWSAGAQGIPSNVPQPTSETTS